MATKENANIKNLILIPFGEYRGGKKQGISKPQTQKIVFQDFYNKERLIAQKKYEHKKQITFTMPLTLASISLMLLTLKH